MTAPDQYRDDFDINTNIRSLSSKPQIQPFAGRIGGNQGLVLDRHDPGNLEVLKKTPDAAPLMTFRDAFNFHGFTDLDLWRFALIECVGILTYGFLFVQ
jgi:hypothetical protein